MLARVVDEAAERFGERTAYVTAEGVSVSYREMADHSACAALWLREQGVSEGDVVALVLPADVHYLALYLGAARLGAITAGINAGLTERERGQLLELVEPSLTIDRASATTPSFDDPPMVARLPDDPDRPVAIVFTSGTTGLPKGAVFTNRQLAAITAIDTNGQWGAGGAALAGNSFASLGPMTKLAGNLMRGGTTYLVDRWRAHSALEMTSTHHLTSVAGIPTQIALMLRDPAFDSFDLSSVRAVVMGGGPATPALVREARERFGAALSIRYSCTEAGIGLGTAFDAPAADAEVSVGRPHPGVELRVVDEDLVPLPDGEVGEVCLRSDAVMAGYWNDPDATAAAFTPDRAVRTGDLGWIDDQGRLRLAGRRKEMYVRGGYNVHPVEVEAVLAAHPSVTDIAIVPCVDDVMGEIGVAIVVPRDASDPPGLDDLRSFGAGSLAAYKLPERVVVVDALPLTPADKIDRRTLRDLVR